jgi:hypothetical protein
MLKKKSTSTLTGTSTGTSTISISNNSGSTLTTVSGGGNMNYITTGYSFTKSIYHILGEEFETDGYLDGTTAVMISTLNVLGRPFYDELRKNNVSFPDKMDKFIQDRLKVIERDKKIDSLIKDNPQT